jgi:hypothetical protein
MNDKSFNLLTVRITDTYRLGVSAGLIRGDVSRAQTLASGTPRFCVGLIDWFRGIPLRAQSWLLAWCPE